MELLDAIGTLVNIGTDVFRVVVGMPTQSDDITKKFRRIVFNLANNTPTQFNLSHAHFTHGRFSNTPPHFISPGEMGEFTVCNRDQEPTGVNGYIAYRIVGTGRSLMIIYSNPVMGRTWSEGHIVGDADVNETTYNELYRKARRDDMKRTVCGTFIVTVVNAAGKVQCVVDWNSEE
ncbi:hypothetical protein HK104_002634 [Borealophlyctis nickersoniae]|nr:hypothetical protein HK104_002634 [Borealophlyctis nickersoniae]